MQEELWEAAFSTYVTGNEQHPNSAELKLAQAVYQLTQTQELQMSAITVNRALKTGPYVDIMFLLFAVDFKRKSVLREQGGVEEIAYGLKKARHYESECKKYIKIFWNHLLKEVELASISEVIIAIDRHEKKAEAVYMRVKNFYNRT